MLLFHGLVKVVENTPNSFKEAFAIDMCGVPASLFDSDGLPRQAKKAALASHIWTTTKQVNAALPAEVSYVTDGGFLLHLLTWYHGSTYNQIVQSYADILI